VGRRGEEKEGAKRGKERKREKQCQIERHHFHFIALYLAHLEIVCVGVRQSRPWASLNANRWPLVPVLKLVLVPLSVPLHLMEGLIGAWGLSGRWTSCGELS